MARFGRMTERRQLRRSAEQALMMAFRQPLDSALAPDISALLAHVPAGLNSSNPESGRVAQDPPPYVRREPEVADQWHDPDETPPFGIALPADGRIDTPSIDSEIFEPSSPRPRRWYRSRHVMAAFIAMAVSAIAVSGVLLVLRSRDSGAEESTTDSSTASTSAAPAPTSAAPAPAITAMSPAPPPPSPLPPLSELPPSPGPTITRPNTQPRQTAPTHSDMPEIGVTRTPATRAPISAAPRPASPPQYDQGDGRRRPRQGW